MATVTAGTPLAPVLYTFFALKDFVLMGPLGEVHCGYMKNLRYSVREGNDALDALVKVWVEEGKVRIGG